ncbi:MAG: hypothetical protein KDK91_09930 [Gammaproteobacteria bacterium]|nr:hypothetical protein [Gammaproteobacteria bacterium]
MSNPISVNPKDASKRNSPVTGPVDEESTVILDQETNVCYWNGDAFKEGQRINCEGAVYECTFGRWVKSG